MNIKIGEKIKQLRQRDGRKQEDLANALGVSPQAISRWEANGGYPDMELIPA
ncbi:MAG: helix-turn-helix transcriptional regulator, partial [Clostridia bacterium]|nr:helix-turn-helix transcriptional regulator [Clostridia bacterium]